MRAAIAVTACLLVSVMALAAESGLKPGDAVPLYNPQHVSGPFKGSTACPT